MDELEQLRDFRSGMRRDHQAARDAARTRLQASMQTRPADPRRRISLLGGLPLVTAAVVVALLLALSPWSGGRNGGQSAAAAQLSEVAERAEALGPSVELADGQFLYSRSETAWISESVAPSSGTEPALSVAPKTREVWVGADGSGRIVQVYSGEVTDTTDSGLVVGLLDITDEEFASGELATPQELWGLTPEQMAKLAADPNALREWIMQLPMVETAAAEAAALRQQTGASPDDGGAATAYQSFVSVADLLRESALQHEFRAAIFRFAATIPDVELVGEVTDTAGRAGIAVAKEHKGVRSELIFDPETAQLLEERQIVVGEHSDYAVEPGTVVGRATYLVTTIVSSTDERP